MCIGIVQGAGHKLDSEWLYNSFQSNPDGAGIAYVEDGQVRISKGHMKYVDLQAAYNVLYDKYGVDNPMLVHCRIATAGSVSKLNCHPFPIKGGAMIHNGHLWSVDEERNGDQSDTREFASMFFNILNYDDLDKAIREGDFDEAIGHDRMAFLYGSGDVLLAGHWYHEKHASFSNTGYKRSSYYGACAVDFEEADYWRYGV